MTLEKWTSSLEIMKSRWIFAGKGKNVGMGTVESGFFDWNPRGKRKLVPKNGWFEKSGKKLQCSTEERETTFGLSYREIRKNEGSRNLDLWTDFVISNVYVCRLKTVFVDISKHIVSLTLFSVNGNVVKYRLSCLIVVYYLIYDLSLISQTSKDHG